MTATNHVVTGCAFAAVTLPYVPAWMVLPAAVLLHFALDALPHFGQTGRQNWGRSLARLRWLLPLDATAAALILLAVFIIAPEHRLLIMAGGILCASPDLLQVARYHRFLTKGETAPGDNWFARFHQNIQWCERLWGKWVEFAWLIVIGSFLFVSI